MSSILLHRMTYDYDRVVPVYVRGGFHWDDAELAALRRFLDADPDDRIEEPVVLDLPVRDLVPDHPAIAGPRSAAWEDVDLEQPWSVPGRNLLLLAKAVVHASLHELPALALGVLREAGRTDDRPEFLLTFQGLTPFAVGNFVQILTPYAQVSKLQAIRKGRDLPLHLTLSCIRPEGGVHCGRCFKCEDRRRNFERAGTEDRTEYAR